MVAPRLLLGAQYYSNRLSHHTLHGIDWNGVDSGVSQTPQSFFGIPHMVLPIDGI